MRFVEAERPDAMPHHSGDMGNFGGRCAGKAHLEMTLPGVSLMGPANSHCRAGRDHSREIRRRRPASRKCGRPGRPGRDRNSQGEVKRRQIWEDVCWSEIKATGLLDGNAPVVRGLRCGSQRRSAVSDRRSRADGPPSLGMLRLRIGLRSFSVAPSLLPKSARLFADRR